MIDTADLNALDLAKLIDWLESDKLTWANARGIASLLRDPENVSALTTAATPPSEEAATDDHHNHLCHGCGHIWWHRKGDGERLEIHRCPKCDSGPYYFGYKTRWQADEDRKHIVKFLATTPPATPVPEEVQNIELTQRLMKFYDEETVEGLLATMEEHIGRLQSKLPKPSEPLSPSPEAGHE
jgi:predicted  nucleic acid-binding Zn-ribbon protein